MRQLEQAPEGRSIDPNLVWRWCMLGFIAVMLVVVAALYEPAHGTVSTKRGDRFVVLDFGHYVGTDGRRTYLVFLAQDTMPSRIDAEVGQLLRDVVEPAADQNGDTILTIQAVRRFVHVGILLNLARVRSYRFVKRGDEWMSVKY